MNHRYWIKEILEYIEIGRVLIGHWPLITDTTTIRDVRDEMTANFYGRHSMMLGSVFIVSLVSTHSTCIDLCIQGQDFMCLLVIIKIMR